MNTIKCDCGSELDKDYSRAQAFYDGSGLRYYSWRCETCGQPYQENAKATVIVGEEEK
jgi:hypothetical protein